MKAEEQQYTFDPYKILGVPREATESQIRRAFRKQARTAHPDGGGSAEAFNMLKRAYDLLSDQESRRLYDETGETEHTQIDPHQAKIIEVLSISLDMALFKLASNPELHNQDILQLTLCEIQEKRRAWSIEKNNYEQALTVSQQLQDRFEVIEGPNLLEKVISGRIETCEKNIKSLEERISLIDQAIEWLKNAKLKVSLGIENHQSRPEESHNELKGISHLFDWSQLIRFQ